MDSEKFKILCLDGGGSKGFYTLGVLEEIEALIKDKSLNESFDLIYGTSTGAIIASLIALGYPIAKIRELYEKHIPQIMKAKNRKQKSKELKTLADEIYGDKTFNDVLTPLSIITTELDFKKPLIFKSDIKQAHKRTNTFKPGFGVSISEAVQASCSAFPVFDKKMIDIDNRNVTLIDGGFCANNPILYALADATKSLKIPTENIRLISIGTGNYLSPKPKGIINRMESWIMGSMYPSFFLRVLDINTQSMEQLQTILYDHISIIRINERYTEEELATDLTEYDLNKLNLLRQKGRESFASKEEKIKRFLVGED